MKRIKYLIIIPLATIVLALLFQSCTKELEPTNFTSLTPNNFFKNETDFKVATAFLYLPFSTQWNQLYNNDPQGYTGFEESCTDEAIGSWGDAISASIINFSVGPATEQNDAVNGFPTIYSYSRKIASATDVIDKIQKSNVDDNLKNKYIAEAKAVRAFLSYTLYDFYGPVNAIYDPAILLGLNPLPRPDADTYKNQMIADLTDAIPDLVEKTNGTDLWGRFNKNAARALLMRIYLNDKQWDKAVTACIDIETNGNYELMTNYADVFNINGNNEIIYASSTYAGSLNWNPTIILPTDIVSANGGLIKPAAAGGNGWRMPWEFYDKYPVGDQRLLTIIAGYVNTNGDSVKRADMIGAIPAKWTNLTTTFGGGYLLDQPVFRLAEVYLSHAEALNELNGPTANSISFAQKVTDRAGITIPDAAKISKDSFRDFLCDERGRELYMEMVRRTDLIRFGKFISSAIARGKTNAKDYMVVYPLPSDVVLRSNGVVSQNPGY